MNQGGVTPFKLPLVYWHWQWLIYSLTHSHTDAIYQLTHLQHLEIKQKKCNSTRYQNLEISSAEKNQKSKGNMTHYQHLDRPKPNSNKNLLLFLMPKHSVWKYGPSGPTPTTNFLFSFFWCRRILLGSTGHPVWIINGEDWTKNLGRQLGEQPEKRTTLTYIRQK